MSYLLCTCNVTAVTYTVSTRVAQTALLHNINPHTLSIYYLQGAANKSNPLPSFVNISTTNKNFCKKIYTAICHSYVRITAKLY